MSDQSALFAPDDGRKPWQRSGRAPETERPAAMHAAAGDTEHLAAAAMTPKAGTYRRKVLDAIAANEPHGLTDWEIHQRVGCLLYTAAPRRNELLNDGWIRDSGRRRIIPTGSTSVVWVLTSNAKAWLRG